MSIPLYSRVIGNESQPALVVAHGLFGSLDNLLAVSKRLEDSFEIHLLDMRNHGQSPHSEEMSYRAMADDVLAYMDDRGLEQAALLGHSMGGKILMQLALDYPSRVTALIVADISPVRYPPHHNIILDGLLAIDAARPASRQEADAILAEFEPVLGIRQFLLKNLERDDGRYKLRLNIDVICRAYDSLAAAPEAEAPFAGSVLFIKGADSAYIQTKHQGAISTLFPSAELRIMPDTTHWLHAQKPELFSSIVRRFLVDGNDDDA